MYVLHNLLQTRETTNNKVIIKRLFIKQIKKVENDHRKKLFGNELELFSLHLCPCPEFVSGSPQEEPKNFAGTASSCYPVFLTGCFLADYHPEGTPWQPPGK